MKTNLFRKFKWYIVGFIMIVIMLSVGLSFCSWDDLGIQALKAKANVGNYYDTHPLNDHVTLVVDINGNKFADLGDIVQYGRYWQDKNATGVEDLKPQRWIVVNIDENKVATLLAEKVVVYGNFWGNGYGETSYHHNYYRSTLRAWLNSGRDSVSASGELGKVGTENLRDDGIGSSFNGIAEAQANRGFLDVAFSDAERAVIVPKKISGMMGKQMGSSIDETFITRGTPGKNGISDLVWVPSWKEIYGTTTTPWGTVTDDPNDKQFQHFANNNVAYDSSNISLQSGATAYALDSTNTNYYNNGAGGHNNGESAKANTWWWLRSPNPTYFMDLLSVYIGGVCANAVANDSCGGVRPALCVQL